MGTQLLTPEQVGNILHDLVMGDPASTAATTFRGNPRYRDQAGYSKQHVLAALNQHDLREILKVANATIIEGRLVMPASTRIWVPKRHGGERPIDIPSIASRVVAEWLLGLHRQTIERMLPPYQFAYRDHAIWEPPMRFPRNRPGNPTDIDLLVAYAHELVNQARPVLLSLDLANAFGELLLGHIERELMSIPGIPPEHARLLVDVAKIETFDAQVNKAIVSKRKARGEVGVEQGNPVSSILLNLALAPALKILSTKGHAPIAFADDISLYTFSENEAEDAYGSFLEIGSPMGFENVRPIGNGDKSSTIFDLRAGAVELLNLYSLHEQWVGLSTEKEREVREALERGRGPWGWVGLGTNRRMRILRKISGCAALTRRWAHDRGLLA